ncbi:monocarboxylate transporter 6-like [Mercenaria mercenaria]|uniref:monocarboxylate transporter 6-like n=1 Tax=Mercenaria mercenaria TaxID=6596 RepID=UPI00234ECD02|nr:monocarboxylate transporter 6-like [Mercenaria mercenaria]
MERDKENKRNVVDYQTNEESCLLPSNNRDQTKLPRTASKRRKVLFMIACMMQQGMSMGIGFGLSVMYAELIIVFNENRSKVALIQSIYMALATGAGIFFTAAIKKIGPGRSMLIGGIFSCIGLFASSFSEGLTAIILCTGVIASIGMGLCYLASFISVTWMFHENAGIYLVILTLGSSLGQFIVPLLYEIFIEKYTWSGAFILMAGIALQTVPFGVIVHCSKQYFVTGVGDKTSTMCDMSVLKDFVIWIILLNFHIAALTGNFEAWFIVDLSISRGFSREAGSVLVSALGFANIIGRMLGGIIRFNCKSIPTVYHWVYLCLILAVGHVLIVNIFDYWGLFTICVLYGIPFGVLSSQIAAIMFETTSLDKYPQAMAISNMALGLANIYSGQIGGSIKDSLGEYDLAFYIAAGLSLYASLTTIVVAFFVRKRKKLQISSQTSTAVKYELLK